MSYLTLDSSSGLLRFGVGLRSLAGNPHSNCTLSFIQSADNTTSRGHFQISEILIEQRQILQFMRDNANHPFPASREHMLTGTKCKDCHWIHRPYRVLEWAAEPQSDAGDGPLITRNSTIGDTCSRYSNYIQTAQNELIVESSRQRYLHS